MKELSSRYAMGLKLGIYSSPWIRNLRRAHRIVLHNPDGENQWIKDGNHNENFRYEKPGGNYWQDRKGDVPPRRSLLRRGTDLHASGPTGRSTTPNTIESQRFSHVKEMADSRATDRDIG